MCVMRHGVFTHGRERIVRSPRVHPRRSKAAAIRRWSAVAILGKSMSRPSRATSRTVVLFLPARNLSMASSQASAS